MIYNEGKYRRISRRRILSDQHSKRSTENACIPAVDDSAAIFAIAISVYYSIWIEILNYYIIFLSVKLIVFNVLVSIRNTLTIAENLTIKVLLANLRRMRRNRCISQRKSKMESANLHFFLLIGKCDWFTDFKYFNNSWVRYLKPDIKEFYFVSSHPGDSMRCEDLKLKGQPTNRWCLTYEMYAHVKVKYNKLVAFHLEQRRETGRKS